MKWFLTEVQTYLLISSLLFIFSKFSLAYLYGYLGYNYLSGKGYNLSILKNLSYFELVFLLTIIYYMIYITFNLFYLLIHNIFDINQFDLSFDIYNYMENKTTDSSTTPVSAGSKTVSSSAAEHGNAVIMTTAVAGGVKLAQSSPTLGGKAAILTGSVVLGSAAIAAKNLSSNFTTNLGSKFTTFNFSNSDLHLDTVLGLSGNDSLDLLILIKIFNSTALILLIIILYNLVLSQINIEKIKNLLLYIFSIKTSSFITNFLVKAQKANNIILILLFMLLLTAVMLSYYYIGFYIENIDIIVEKYLSQKVK